MTPPRLSLALLCLLALTLAAADRSSIDSDSVDTATSKATVTSASDPLVTDPSSGEDDEDNSENGGAGAISRGQQQANHEKEIDETHSNTNNNNNNHNPDTSSAQSEEQLRSVLQRTFDHISTISAVADSPVRDPKQQSAPPSMPADTQSLAPSPPQVIAATPNTLNTLRAAAKTLKQRLHVMDGLRKRVLRLYSQYASASLDPSAIERLDHRSEGAAPATADASAAQSAAGAPAEVNEADMSGASAIFGGAAIPIVGESEGHDASNSDEHKAALLEIESSAAEFRPSDMMKGPLFVGVPAHALREREKPTTHHVTHPPLTQDQMAARALRLKQRLEQMQKRSKVAPPTKAMGHYSNCYNANLLLGKDQRSLCNAISSDLAEPYEDSAAFNEACTGLLGSYCAGECRMLANMFDSPTYNHDSEETTSTYPLATNNKVLGYTISRDDCRRCLVYGQCYNTISVPTNPDAYYSAP